jgi:nickel/cobalt exporter
MGSDERAKLKTLLNYWVEHNREHSQEFKEWADKARVMGEAKVAEEMLQAVQAMDRASGLLSQSLKRLEEE